MHNHQSMGISPSYIIEAVTAEAAHVESVLATIMHKETISLPQVTADDFSSTPESRQALSVMQSIIHKTGMKQSLSVNDLQAFIDASESFLGEAVKGRAFLESQRILESQSRARRIIAAAMRSVGLGALFDTATVTLKKSRNEMNQSEKTKMHKFVAAIKAFFGMLDHFGTLIALSIPMDDDDKPKKKASNLKMFGEGQHVGATANPDTPSSDRYHAL